MIRPRNVSRIISKICTAIRTKYSESVLEHYNNPRNVGMLDDADPNVGTGLVGMPACGDVMRLQFKVDDNGVIVETAFKTFGCGSAIASSSLATEKLKGKTLAEAAQLTNKDIAGELLLPPVKMHCSMLAEDAVRAALNNLQSKRLSKAKSEVN
jgi:Fe-S cluster assembly scaffold IscU